MTARLVQYEGHVQGVGFRYTVKTIARGFDVSGTVRNLPDGRVEVLACGTPEAVDALCAWLWQGSPASSVSAVAIEELALESVQPWPPVFRTT